MFVGLICLSIFDHNTENTMKYYVTCVFVVCNVVLDWQREKPVTAYAGFPALLVEFEFRRDIRVR